MRADNREDVFQLIPAGMGTETRRRNQNTEWLAEATRVAHKQVRRRAAQAATAQSARGNGKAC